MSNDRPVVRTRFAPSPTGPLHIGGVRTALFNYLFARHHGGEFLLRIEDTDRERSTDAATQGIVASLDWLDLTRDGQTIYQSQRVQRHAEVARELLAMGRAYNCYLTPEEIAAERYQAREDGRQWHYDGRWRDRDPAEAPPGVKPAIRLKAPREGETEVEDLVQGSVRVANAEMDDLVILRNDGTPTYNHSVVVDDHDMGITHVIRGDDHLTNTFRQSQIYAAMGWTPPRFAPPAADPRAGWGQAVEAPRRAVRAGVPRPRLPAGGAVQLPAAPRLVAWRYRGARPRGGDPAVRPRWRRPCPVAHGLRQAELPQRRLYPQADDDRLARETMERLTRRPGLVLNDAAAARIRRLVPALKERAKTLEELADLAAFLARPVPLPIEPKAAALLTSDAREMLRDLAAALAVSDFTPEALDATLRAFAEQAGRKLGQVAQPLRAALTGSTASPGIDLTLAALGREETLIRLAAVAS